MGQDQTGRRDSSRWGRIQVRELLFGIAFMGLVTEPAPANAASGEPAPKVVAVFNMDARRAAGLCPPAPEPSETTTKPKVDASHPELLCPLAAELSERLKTKLLESRAFVVAQDPELHARATEMQVESYKQCYDAACQIELGKAVAAQAIIQPSIAQSGDACSIALQVVDLKTEVAQTGASVESGCSAAELRLAVDRIVDSLVAPGTGTLEVESEPKGALLKVDGEVHGETPALVRRLAPGVHELSLTLDRYDSAQRTARVSAAALERVTVQLTPAASTKEVASRVAFWGCAIGAVASGVTAAVFGVKALGIRSDLQGQSAGDPATSDRVASGRSSALIADISGVIGLAFVGGAILLW